MMAFVQVRAEGTGAMVCHCDVSDRDAVRFENEDSSIENEGFSTENEGFSTEK